MIRNRHIRGVAKIVKIGDQLRSGKWFGHMKKERKSTWGERCWRLRCRGKEAKGDQRVHGWT